MLSDEQVATLKRKAQLLRDAAEGDVHTSTAYILRGIAADLDFLADAWSIRAST